MRQLGKIADFIKSTLSSAETNTDVEEMNKKKKELARDLPDPVYWNQLDDDGKGNVKIPSRFMDEKKNLRICTPQDTMAFEYILANKYERVLLDVQQMFNQVRICSPSTVNWLPSPTVCLPQLTQNGNHRWTKTAAAA